MLVVIFLAIVTYLKLLRFSRSMWLHLMVKHDPEQEKISIQASQELINQSKEWKPRVKTDK